MYSAMIFVRVIVFSVLPASNASGKFMRLRLRVTRGSVRSQVLRRISKNTPFPVQKNMIKLPPGSPMRKASVYTSLGL